MPLGHTKLTLRWAEGKQVTVGKARGVVLNRRSC